MSDCDNSIGLSVVQPVMVKTMIVIHAISFIISPILSHKAINEWDQSALDMVLTHDVSSNTTRKLAMMIRNELGINITPL